MQNALDGRRLFIWRGQDLVEDLNRLADAVAEKAGAELFNLNGTLMGLNDGQFVSVNRNSLREIIARHLASIRWVNRGTIDMPRWEGEYHPFDFPPGADLSKEPDDRVLSSLMNDLVLRVAKGPTKPFRLTLQQRSEISARLKQGEPKDDVARAYGVDIATIQRLAR